MKKILTLFISAIMLISLFPCACAYSDTQEQAVTVISGLGLMNGYDDGTFLPDDTMTRAEFAQVMANIYSSGEESGDSEWRDQFFKDEEEETSLVTKFEEDGVQRFIDVPTTHWAYSVINTVCDLGLMNGISETEFDPESIITVDQAYKVIVSLLGYRPKALIKGGYPTGYRILASDLGLTSGVKSTDRITRGDVAKILYNALDVELLQLGSIGDSVRYNTIEGETFTTKILNYSWTRGRMTDNGMTNLEGASSISEKDVVVNGVQIRLTQNTQYIKNYIGRDIKIFYKEENGTQYAVYAYLSGKDTTVTFDISEFKSFSDNTITYEPENTESQKTVKIENGARMIYNGTGILTYGEDTFKSVNKGTVTVVKSSGKSVGDVILLESYTSFYVDLKDTNEKKLYSISTLVDNKCLDLSDEDKNVFIYDANGDLTTFDAISTGTILSVSDSEKVMKLYIGNGTQSDVTVTEMNTEDGIVNVICDTQKYVLSKDYIELNGTSNIEAGGKYTFYIDKFNEIIKVEKAKKDGIKAAIVLDVKNFGNIDSDYRMKYFTEDGEMKESRLAGKVTLKNASGSEKTYKNLSDLALTLKNYGMSICRVTINDEKEVNYIELAGSQTTFNNENNRLLRLKLSDTLADTEKVEAYYKINVGFDGKAIVSGSTKVFKYNPVTLDDDSFEIGTVGANFSNDSRYKIYAYTTQGDSKIADYIVYETETESTLQSSNKYFAIVKRIYKGLDTKGDPTNVVEVYMYDGTEKKMYCEDSVLASVEDIYGNTSYPDYDTKNSGAYKLEIGDIIRYMENSDGSIKKFQLMFDENAINPHSGGQGHLPGTIGYFDSTDYKHSMPYAEYNGSYNSSALSWRAEELRNFVAYPLLYRSGMMSVTSMDLQKLDYNKNLDLIGTSYASESHVWSATTTVYRIEGNTLVKESLASNEIKTYENAQNNADRMFLSTRVGALQRSFVIRGYTQK